MTVLDSLPSVVRLPLRALIYLTRFTLLLALGLGIVGLIGYGIYAAVEAINWGIGLWVVGALGFIAFLYCLGEWLEDRG